MKGNHRRTRSGIVATLTLLALLTGDTSPAATQTAAVVQVKDIWRGQGDRNCDNPFRFVDRSSCPESLTAVGDTVFFSANDGATGDELWKSEPPYDDSTTTLVRDINPGFTNTNRPAPSSPFYLTNVNGTVFFKAFNETTGVELWKSDGTAEGTTLVKDIHGGGWSFPRLLTAVGGDVFFTADDGVSGVELWKSDGTEAGTILVKDIWPGSCSRFGSVSPCDSRPSRLTAVGDTLFFRANDGIHGDELWKSDGSEQGTTLVKDVNLLEDSFPKELTAFDDALFFVADDGIHDTELWKSDGTEQGTALVKDIALGPSSSDSFFGYGLTAFDDSLFFAASDGIHGRELWKSDGTEGGTTLVKDINEGGESSGPGSLTSVGRTLFFAADDGQTGRELWKSQPPYDDASTSRVSDIIPGQSASSPSNLATLNGTLFFVADDFFADDGGQVGRELWQSDGTEAGTILVADIWPGPGNFRCDHIGEGSSCPDELTVVGDTLFFSADDGRTGIELWKARINRPPDCTGVTASPDVIETAVRDQFQSITLSGASDPDGDALSLRINTVSQDEPVSGEGMGDDTSPDARLTAEGEDSNEVLVRTERSPMGNGRVYRIAFTVSDVFGGVCSGTAGVGGDTNAQVSVPRKKGETAVDDGDTNSWNSFTGELMQ